MVTRQHPKVQTRRRGRPFVHDEAWSKVSVVLFDRQVEGLDRIVNAVRRQTGQARNRAGIIRALIGGLLESGWDISAIAAEADLRSQVARRLKSRPSKNN